MINIYPYEGENVRIVCRDGRVYTGIVKLCSPACWADPGEDMLVIGNTEIFTGEIEEIDTADE